MRSAKKVLFVQRDAMGLVTMVFAAVHHATPPLRKPRPVERVTYVRATCRQTVIGRRRVPPINAISVVLPNQRTIPALNLVKAPFV